MARIEDLAERFGKHLATPWQRTVSGEQRVIMVVYDKDMERILRARKISFETATHEAGHDWREVDVSDAFARWMSQNDYREEYFASPDILRPKLDAEFPKYVAELIRAVLKRSDVTENSVVAVFGVGALFGFARMSHILQIVADDIQGRLVVFFPGHLEHSNYRLLDARDGPNYSAVPITAHGEGASL